MNFLFAFGQGFLYIDKTVTGLYEGIAYGRVSFCNAIS